MSLDYCILANLIFGGWWGFRYFAYDLKDFQVFPFIKQHGIIYLFFLNLQFVHYYSKGITTQKAGNCSNNMWSLPGFNPRSLARQTSDLPTMQQQLDVMQYFLGNYCISQEMFKVSKNCHPLLKLGNTSIIFIYSQSYLTKSVLNFVIFFPQMFIATKKIFAKMVVLVSWMACTCATVVVPYPIFLANVFLASLATHVKQVRLINQFTWG